MSAERDLRLEMPEELRREVQKIIDILKEGVEDRMEIIDLGSMDSTPEEQEMMALMHYLRKGWPMHEAEKKAKEVVKVVLETEREVPRLRQLKELSSI